MSTPPTDNSQLPTPNSHLNGSPTWLVDSKRSATGSWAIHAAGILQFIGAVAMVYDNPAPVEFAFAAILALSGTLFLQVAAMLGAEKGGVRLRGEKVELFGCSTRDSLTLPKNNITGIHVVRRKEFWGKDSEPTFTSSIEAARHSGTTLLLLEMLSLDNANEAALTFRQVTGWPIQQKEWQAPEQHKALPNLPGIQTVSGDFQTVVTLQLGPRYALGPLTFTLALFAMVTGVLLLLGMEATGILGAMFGPFMAALGVCCMGLFVFRAFGAENLTLSPGALNHSIRLGPWTFGNKELVTKNLAVRPRVRSRGPLGFSLELMAGDQILPVGTGINRHCRVKPESLLQLGDYIAWKATKRSGK
jgi:hypothetical protein